MRVREAFDAVSNWMTAGNAVWCMTKSFGVVSLAIASVLSPLFFIGNANENSYKKELAEMDSRPAVVFNSVADCVNKGFDSASCLASQQKAMDIAGSLGTDLSYSSGQECEDRHRSCTAQTTMITTFINAGEPGLGMISTPTTSYYPSIVGWEAERDNLNKAVPLYQSAQREQAVRWDGRALNIRQS